MEKYFLKTPTQFMVNDTSVVTPLSSVSTILEQLKVPINDIEELLVTIGQEEALAILEAAMASGKVLTSVLNIFLWLSSNGGNLQQEDPDYRQISSSRSYCLKIGERCAIFHKKFFGSPKSTLFTVKNFCWDFSYLNKFPSHKMQIGKKQFKHLMMMKMTSCYYVLVLSGFLLLHAASATLEENCKKIAGQTVTYESCMASLGADPNSKTADLPALGIIASKLTLAKGNELQSHIENLLKENSAGDQKLINGLNSCKDEYAEILPDSCDVAIRGFELKNYNDANVRLSAIMDSPGECESGLKELGATANPQLVKMNEEFKNLAAIALHISAILLGLRQ